jgi:hypothetical protein
MDRDDLTGAVWRTSSYSSGNGQCVEVARTTKVVVLRDSKNPAGDVLRFPRQQWAVFTLGLEPQH